MLVTIKYKFLGFILMLFVTLFFDELNARDIMEYDRLFSEASKIRKESIDSLNLVGKSASCGMQHLASIGYKCNIQPPLRGFDIASGLECNKPHKNKFCATSSVILGVDWGEGLSYDEKSSLLDDAKIEIFTVICHFN